MSGDMVVVAAPDKFRGSATARQVADAIAEGASDAGWACTKTPLADGGEGTLEALGGGNRTTTVPNALGHPVVAEWRLDDRGVAVVEMSRASGLSLVGGRRGNDPVRSSTEGTGALIAAAIDAGAARVIVGVGGSATTDGGQGAVDILQQYAPFGLGYRAEVVVACDVRTTFLDAARDFAPQKGATSEQVVLLEERLVSLRGKYLERFGVDVAQVPGGGAGGGLAGGLSALGAQLVPGFELIARHAGLKQAMSSASAVITGEGFFDGESLNGKVVGGVLELAQTAQLPAVVIAGDADRSGFIDVSVVSLVEQFGAVSAWEQTLYCVRRATYDRLSACWSP